MPGGRIRQLNQGYADQHATKLFFSGLKAVYGPTSKSMTPIRAEDGTLLTDKEHILERWSAHFNQLLNKVSSVEEQAISGIRQRPIILALDGCPTVAETQKAIDQLQTGKSPGADGILFIDLTKAFDTVSRPGLWSILAKLGRPPNFIRMVRSFHDGMMARMIHDGVVSEPFPVTNGVKQGCVLAPTLFSLLFAEMLSSALANTDAGITIRYRTDGRFF